MLINDGGCAAPVFGQLCKFSPRRERERARALPLWLISAVKISAAKFALDKRVLPDFSSRKSWPQLWRNRVGIFSQTHTTEPAAFSFADTELYAQWCIPWDVWQKGWISSINLMNWYWGMNMPVALLDYQSMCLGATWNRCAKWKKLIKLKSYLWSWTSWWFFL